MFVDKKFKIGKVCDKHPELRGERQPNGDCLACRKVAARARYLANKDKYLAKSKAQREADPVKAAAYHKAWREANKERKAAMDAAYQAANKERTQANRAKWYSANLDVLYAHCAKRRATKLRATPKWADDKRIKEIYRLSTQISKATGIEHHVDHIVPLKSKIVCGLHVEHNLRVIAGAENLSKSNRHWADMPS